MARSTSSARAALMSGYTGPSAGAPRTPYADVTPSASTATDVAMPDVTAPPTFGSTVTVAEPTAVSTRAGRPPAPAAASTGAAVARGSPTGAFDGSPGPTPHETVVPHGSAASTSTVTPAHGSSVRA
jgi:hypothetical protein